MYTDIYSQSPRITLYNSACFQTTCIHCLEWVTSFLKLFFLLPSCLFNQHSFLSCSPAAALPSSSLLYTMHACTPCNSITSTHSDNGYSIVVKLLGPYLFRDSLPCWIWDTFMNYMPQHSFKVSLYWHLNNTMARIKPLMNFWSWTFWAREPVWLIYISTIIVIIANLVFLKASIVCISFSLSHHDNSKVFSSLLSENYVTSIIKTMICSLLILYVVKYNFVLHVTYM